MTRNDVVGAARSDTNAGNERVYRAGHSAEGLRIAGIGAGERAADSINRNRRAEAHARGSVAAGAVVIDLSEDAAGRIERGTGSRRYLRGRGSFLRVRHRQRRSRIRSIRTRWVDRQAMLLLRRA